MTAVGRLWVACLLLPAACSAPGTVTTSTTKPSDGNLATSTTIAEVPALVELPAGVVWEPMDLPASDAPTIVTVVLEGREGFVAAGTRVLTHPAGRQIRTPVVWRSDDGQSWAEVTLPPESLDEDRLIYRGVSGPAGYVLAGVTTSRCPQPEVYAHPEYANCPGRDVFVLHSADGATWEVGVAPDGSFTSGIAVGMTGLAATAGGFMAVGIDKRNGPDWAFTAWISADGRTWERTLHHDDTWQGVLDARLIGLVDGTFLVDSGVAICGNVQDVAYGEGWVVTVETGPAKAASRLWRSGDGGVTWERVDLLAAGLVEADPQAGDVDCDGLRAGEFGLPQTEGRVTLVGAELRWDAERDDETLTWTSTDGVVWEQVALTTAEILPEGFDLLGGGAWSRWLVDRPAGVVAIEARNDRGRLHPRVWLRAGESEWTDLTAYGMDLPRIDPPGSAGYMVLLEVADTGEAVYAYGADESSGSPRALLLRSIETSLPALPEPDACVPAPSADCRFADLAGADLAGADLRQIDLGGADLTGADLTGADLTGARLVGARLGGARLAGARLEEAVLSRAELGRSDLSGVVATGTDLSWTNFDGALVAGADFTGADFTGCRGFPFAGGATLTGGDFSECSLLHFGDEPAAWDLSGLVLRHASVVIGDFSGASFVGTDLSHGMLGATFAGAYFSGADLTGVSFSGADLTGAGFSGAIFDGTTWFGSTCPDGVAADHLGTCEGHLLDR